MRRLALCALVWSIPLAGPLPAAGETLVDRIVAVVDDDPIFLSDIRRVVGLGLVTAAPGETEGDLHRRVLDALIDQRLRYHEVERFDYSALPADEIERQLGEVRGRFADEAAFRRHLVELGLTEEGLRQLLARQLRVLAYVEQRLGPRVFVETEDIRAYYDGELARQAAAEGVELPPLEEVRDEIRALLREVRLNQEIDRWTEDLRLAAEIRDHLDRPESELPPVVRRFE